MLLADEYGESIDMSWIVNVSARMENNDVIKIRTKEREREERESGKISEVFNVTRCGV